MIKSKKRKKKILKNLMIQKTIKVKKMIRKMEKKIVKNQVMEILQN